MLYAIISKTILQYFTNFNVKTTLRIFQERNNIFRFFWRMEEIHTFADGLLIEKEYTLLRWCSVYNIERKKWDSAENYVTCMPREIQERAIMAVVLRRESRVCA